MGKFENKKQGHEDQKPKHFMEANVTRLKLGRLLYRIRLNLESI